MADPIFCKLSPALTVDRLGSASDEGNLSFSEVVASTNNEGALQVRASGVPSAAIPILVRLVSGGIANGPTTQTDGVPGARFRFRQSSGVDSEYTGYTYPGFLRDIRTVTVADATTAYPHVTGVRRLSNGFIGYLRINNDVADSLVFGYKTARRTAYTYVTVASSGLSVHHRPALAVLAGGRLLAFGVMSASSTVRVWSSDDHGVTWSIFAKRTSIVIDASGGAIHADVVGDAIVVVSGSSELYTVASTYVYWSVDGGQNYALGGSIAGTIIQTGALIVNVAGIPLYVASVDDGAGLTTTCAVYSIAYGGGFGASTALGGISVDRTNPVVGACALDDGSLWAMGGNDYPAQAFNAYVSVDDGLTWGPVGGGISGATTLADTQYTSGGYRGIALGCFEGTVVVMARTDTGLADQDNSIHEWHLGGYDQLTETDTGGSSNGSRDQVGYYGDNAGAVFFPTDLPDSLGWTKADTGTGATVGMGSQGFLISATAGNTTLYTAPASFWSPDAGDSWRIRWKTYLTSGGDIASDAAIVMIAVSDATNRQWIKVRLSATQARAIDNSGTIWTSAVGTFTGEIEWMLAFAHDYPSAGGGQAALRYRDSGSDAWTTAFEAQAIAEEAGVATEVISFGGTSATAGAVWYITGPWFAPGSDEMDAAWTNPSDLDGRPLTPFVDVQVIENISIGASGDAGVAGDLFTITPAYAKGKKNLLRSLRPSCAAETLLDSVDATYVLGDGTMPIAADVVAIIGSNYRTATMQLHPTDSWATPAQTVSLDATLYSSLVSASVAGRVTLTSAAMIPHRYRSTPNRKYYITFQTGAATYEIEDNDEQGVYVSGMPASYAGDVARIFGDRMAARFTASNRMYARLFIGAQPTTTDTFITGTPWLGMAHAITFPYDNGFVDSWEPNYSEWGTDAGLRQGARRGGESHKLRIAWGAIDRLTLDYVERVTRLFRSLDGAVVPFLFWRDPDDISTLGLYTIDGPPGTENSYGELRTAFERIPQIILTEYR